jgi:AraC-like DNA-binding protein
MLTIDVIARVAAATLWLLLAMRLLSAAPRERLVRWFVPLALSVVGFLAGNTIHADARFSGVAADLAGLLSGSAALFLWWFCLAYFDDSFRLGRLEIAVALLWLPLMLLDRGWLGDAFAGVGLSWALVVLGLGICLHLVARLMRDREGDLVETRRRGRLWVVAALLGLLLVDLLVDLALGFQWKPWRFTLAQNVVLLALGGHLTFRWLAVDLDRLAHAAPRPGASPAATEAVVAPAVSADGPRVDEVLLQRLSNLMEVERVHRDPALTFAGFAARMGAPESDVRRLINQHLGWRHFRPFLNHYRLQDAKAALADPAQAQRKILAIAFDAGFASLPSFNRSFREAEGLSPGEYRARALAVGHPSEPQKP